MPKGPVYKALLKAAKKRAQNEVAFQKANEILMKAAKATASPGYRKDTFPFTCECSDLKCGKAVELSIDQFERVLKCSAWFVIEPHHDQPDIDKVVEKHHTYWVVAKHPGLLAKS